MENDDILKEILKLKEANLSVQNHLADLEAKILRSNNHSTKNRESYKFNLQDSSNAPFNNQFKLEKSSRNTLGSNTDFFDIKKFELIEELYQRSRKHLDTFQKKCDNLLNQANSPKINDKSIKKNDQLYHAYLNRYLDEDNIKNQSKNRKKHRHHHHHKTKSLYHTNSSDNNIPSKYISRNAKINDFDNKFYGDFNLPKEPINNYNINLKKPNYKNNIEFYKKCTLNISDTDITSSLKSNLSDTSLIDSHEYEQTSLLTPNTSDTIDESDISSLDHNNYVNKQYLNNIQGNVPFPYQFQYKFYNPQPNPRFYNPQPNQKDFSNRYQNKKYSFSNSSSSLSSSSSSSDWSMVSAISSSSSTKSSLSKY